MKAIVAERGQVTIPQALRKKMGIRPGVVLDFKVQGSKLIAIKEQENDPVAKVFGCLGKTINTDQFLDEIRGGT